MGRQCPEFLEHEETEMNGYTACSDPEQFAANEDSLESERGHMFM
jgi:hypothetical protein